MPGTHMLILAVVIVFVFAFIITMLVLNASAKKIISTNTKLVENYNLLLEQNNLLENVMKEQQEIIDTLKKQRDELTEKLKHLAKDDVTLLHQQTQEHRERIERTADMTDKELLAWIDETMDETQLFKDSALTLKTMAQSLGLTQKKLAGLFKVHPKYNSLGDYLNEKRLIYACLLLREEPNWTIEAVGAEAGFGSRRTFQTEMKRRLGITPQQYRQSQA